MNSHNQFFPVSSGSVDSGLCPGLFLQNSYAINFFNRVNACVNIFNRALTR